MTRRRHQREDLVLLFDAERELGLAATSLRLAVETCERREQAVERSSNVPVALVQTWDRQAAAGVEAALALVRRCRAGGASLRAVETHLVGLQREQEVLATPVSGPLAHLARMRRSTLSFQLGAALLAMRTAIAQAGAAATGGAVRTSALAHRLVAVAVRALPVASRARYLEEFAGELVELAAGRRPRVRQLRHALRLLGRAVPLGRELRRPKREPA